MAKSPTTCPPGVSAPGRDLLVATKFHVPRAGFVPRPRLLARLSQGTGSGLTVVSTPAGFGKTTMLGDWARRGRPGPGAARDGCPGYGIAARPTAAAAGGGGDGGDQRTDERARQGRGRAR